MVELEIIFASILLLGLGFAGIAVKILLKKDGQFSGTCASNSPFLNKDGEACGLCGALPDEQCQSEDDSAEQAA